MAMADEDAVSDRFDALVGGLDYPMFIVTVTDGTDRAGCLVGFAAQCSIAPPLFMAWLSVNNHTFTVARRTETLAVHVLPRQATDLAALFGTRTGFEVDKFTHCRWRHGPGGVPLLDDCPTWFIGTVTARHRTGDHMGMLLKLTEVSPTTTVGQQLGFQQVRNLPAGNEA
jgi:flavin reductase (DIM6/NTAB) family NADH-FMN oxidoreductase RutF